MIVDRGTAGTSSKFTTSGSGYNQSDDDAASSGSAQSKHGLVRQLDNSPRTTPKRNESHNTLVRALLCIYHVVQ